MTWPFIAEGNEERTAPAPPCPFLHSDPGISRDRDSIFIHPRIILVDSKIHIYPDRQGSHECAGASSLCNQLLSLRLRARGPTLIGLSGPQPQVSSKPAESMVQVK